MRRTIRKDVFSLLEQVPRLRSSNEINYLMNQFRDLELFSMFQGENEQNQKDILFSQVIQEMRLERFKTQGEYIYKQGKLNRKFYIVLSGKVRLIRHVILEEKQTGKNQTKQIEDIEEEEHDADFDMRKIGAKKTVESQKSDVVLKEVGIGDYFGEIEFIFNTLRYCNAIAAQEEGEDICLGVFNFNEKNVFLSKLLFEKNPFLRSLPLLQMVSTHCKIRLAYFNKQRILKRNDSLYRQGDRIQSVYFLEQGTIQMQVTLRKQIDVVPNSHCQKQDEIQLISVISNGQILGDEDLLSKSEQLSSTKNKQQELPFGEENDSQRGRQYSAIVISNCAVIYSVDLNTIYKDIVSYYGRTKAHKMIKSYLEQKQLYRRKIAQIAQQIKQTFTNFSHQPIINQNLIQFTSESPPSPDKKDSLQIRLNQRYSNIPVRFASLSPQSKRSDGQLNISPLEQRLNIFKFLPQKKTKNTLKKTSKSFFLVNKNKLKTLSTQTNTDTESEALFMNQNHLKTWTHHAPNSVNIWPQRDARNSIYLNDQQVQKSSNMVREPSRIQVKQRAKTEMNQRNPDMEIKQNSFSGIPEIYSHKKIYDPFNDCWVWGGYPSTMSKGKSNQHSNDQEQDIPTIMSKNVLPKIIQQPKHPETYNYLNSSLVNDDTMRVPNRLQGRQQQKQQSLHKKVEQNICFRRENNVDDHVSNRKVNRFIEKFCNGNEIYELETSNSIGKKKILLDSLLVKMGSTPLNCIGIHQQSKNSQYSFKMRMLERKKRLHLSKSTLEPGSLPQHSLINEVSPISFSFPNKTKFATLSTQQASFISETPTSIFIQKYKKIYS